MYVNYMNRKVAYGDVVFKQDYVDMIYYHISENYFNVVEAFNEEPTLNEFLNKINYPEERNVNFDMIVYYVRDNKELVEFNLL